jgi:hypothetical protein
MIARFDHRPMLTALLALSTSVLVVVVITLATVLHAAPPAATSSSVSDSGNAGQAAPANMDAGGESYGWDIQTKPAEPAQTGDSAAERHHESVSDYYHYAR